MSCHGNKMKVSLSAIFLTHRNNKKRSHTQLDSRKQVIAFQDRVMTINIKEAQHPLEREKQVIDKSSIMLKISTKSMHKLKFSIQIPPDLRKESFWLLGGYRYHCNTKVSSCQPLSNIECSNCVCRSFKIFLNFVAG